MERVFIEMNGKCGVIQEVYKGSAVVQFDDSTTQIVKASECTMIPPKEHDMVLVTEGVDIGLEGEVVCIDKSDAIVQNSNGDFKLVDLVYLAKIDKQETWIRHAELYRTMALTRLSTKNYDTALLYYEKAKEYQEKAFGTNEHPEISITYINIGSIYGEMGNYVKELEYYEKAISIVEKEAHPDSPT